MNPIQPRFGPQFGWISSGHIAMEKAAVHVLPASPWKDFLNDNLPWVHRHSMAQDVDHKGPDHYINLESSDDFGKRVITPDDRTVEGVSKHFTPAYRQQLADHFEKQPLDPEALRALRPAVAQPPEENWEGQTNALERINQSYRALVGQLQHIGEHPPGWIFSKARHIKQLEKAVGELSHYVTDLHQPMHTTGYHSWPIAYVWRAEDGHDTNSSHEFFEQALLGSEELWAWGQSYENNHAIPRAVGNNTINARLAREIERGYTAMPDLVDADRIAWEGSGNAQQYFDSLKKHWQPVAASQMGRATDNLSAILQSAYVDAGMPDLSKLAMSEKTMSFICWFTSLPGRILDFIKKPFRALGLG